MACAASPQASSMELFHPILRCIRESFKPSRILQMTCVSSTIRFYTVSWLSGCFQIIASPPCLALGLKHLPRSNTSIRAPPSKCLSCRIVWEAQVCDETPVSLHTCASQCGRVCNHFEDCMGYFLMCRGLAAK